MEEWNPSITQMREDQRLKMNQLKPELRKEFGVRLSRRVTK